MAYLGNTIVGGTLKVLNDVNANKVSGDGSGLTSLNASNISSGTLNAARLATSGASAGSYGPSAAVTGTNNATMNVPYITVDAYGRVTSISNKVYTSKDTTYSANNGVGLSGTTFYNSGVRSIATGSANGTISVNTNGTSADVAVKGLGSAAYTASTAYAAASHGNHVPATQTANNAVFLRNDNSWQTVTPANIGAAASSHTHNYAGSSSAGGAATSLANFKVTTTANNAIDTPGSNAIAYASGLTKANWNYQQTDGGYYCQWYSASWFHEIFGDYRTGQISVRGNNNGTKTAWRRVLDESNYSSIITGYAASSHTHNYAGSSSAGGAATSAAKLNTNAGSATQPVYFSNGVPVATTYALNATVPSGAKFTDTTYTANNGVGLSGTTFYNSGVRSIATGSANGTISVNTNGTAADVAVKGLGTGAYAAAYVHPTGAGNNHIPSGGSSGQFLKWSSSGVAVWAADNNTLNTAGSTNSTSKLFLIGATSQAANPQTYSHSSVYETAGVLNATSYTIDTHGAIAYNSGTGCVEITVA